MFNNQIIFRWEKESYCISCIRLSIPAHPHTATAAKLTFLKHVPQITIKPDPNMSVLQGDALITKCTYSTEDRNKVTVVSHRTDPWALLTDFICISDLLIISYHIWSWWFLMTEQVKWEIMAFAFSVVEKLIQHTIYTHPIGIDFGFSKWERRYSGI